jgi:hypothetical protein
MLHSVYDQPSAQAVHAQFDKLLDSVEEKLPDVHAHLDAARADLLAFTAYLPGGPGQGRRDGFDEAGVGVGGDQAHPGHARAVRSRKKASHAGADSPVALCTPRTSR